jgi:hypothetical protein
MRRWRSAPLILGVMAALAVAGAGWTMPPVQTGDRQGIALWARVSAAYRTVPGASVVVRSGPLTVRFDDALRGEVVDGIAARATLEGRTTYLVGHVGSATFTKDPGRRCWRHVAASDPQAVVEASPDGRASVMFSIDRRTLMVRSFTTRAGNIRGTGEVRALPAAPRIPAAVPRC